MLVNRTSLNMILATMALAAFTPAASAMLHPGLGRFVQRDPLGYVDGMNLVQYAISNSLRFRDPSGLAANDDCKDLRCPGEVKIKIVYTDSIESNKTWEAIQKRLAGYVGKAIPAVNILSVVGGIAADHPSRKSVGWTLVARDCIECPGERFMRNPRAKRGLGKVRVAELFTCNPTGLPGNNQMGGFDATQPNFWTGSLPRCAEQVTPRLKDALKAAYPHPACKSAIEAVKPTFP